MARKNLGIFGVACIGLLTVSAAATVSAATRTPDSYARPGKRIVIGQGRSLNLRCIGKGSVTVLLEAGSHADSSNWFRVQPILAEHARVCAYDRAGHGFSDEGPLPRGLDADVSDLHALIGAAGLHTPLVLVGHSLGTNIVRRYAGVHPGDVAAMVLVDPPAQNLGHFLPAQWMKDEATTASQRDAFIGRCEQGAERDELTSPPPALARCIGGPAPWESTKVAAANQAHKLRPAFWHTLRSELAQNTQIFAQPVPEDESHGDMPLVVLRASDTYADAPADVRQELEAARRETQRRIVATSTRGELQMVADSSHDIELDQPQAVVDAVTHVLTELAPAHAAPVTATTR